MPASVIKLPKEFIINCVAEHYNIDVTKTALNLKKDDKDYIEITWDAQLD